MSEGKKNDYNKSEYRRVLLVALREREKWEQGKYSEHLCDLAMRSSLFNSLLLNADARAFAQTMNVVDFLDEVDLAINK